MPLSGSRRPQAFGTTTPSAISPASSPSALDSLTVPGTPSRTSSKATDRRDAAITTASSVLSLVGEVAKAVADVPYVGAIATIVTTLIKIHEELKANKERSEELLDRVLEKIEGIFTHLLDLKECGGQGDFKRLETQMRKYYEFLTQVVKTVTGLQKRKFYQRVFDRGTNELERLDRRINNLDSNLILGVIMEIMKTSTNKAQIGGARAVIQDSSLSTHFPPAPIRILEREEQHREIVTKLLSTPNVRVALLGMGGIGKTTLACSIARDPEITKAYLRRIFVSFEGCPTPDLAYTNIATMFEIPLDQRASHRQILSQVLSYLGQEKTLIVIDNFETWWEVPGNRRVAESFLCQLAALQGLGMIVTLRGTQRPTGIDWVKSRPLPTLTQDASMDLLSAVTKENYIDGDLEYVRKLLDAVAGIPLAVTLIGSLLRDELETPQSLWSQWTRESARAIRLANGTDPDERLYRLDISLRLSIFGPRMNEDARNILASISILPTGLNMDEDWLERYQALLPDVTHLRDLIRILRDVALVTLDQSTSPHRLRLLPPIRDFCLKNLPLDCELPHRLIDIYTADLRKYCKWGSSGDYTWMTTELSNATAILNHAITIQYVADGLGWAIYRYTEWRRFLCIPETDTVKRAIVILSEYPEAKAKCLQGLGATLSNFDHDQEAIQPLEDALFIHRKVGIKDQEGWDLYLLGNAHCGLNNYDKAEQCLNEAVSRFTEIDNKWKKGGALEKLADVYLQQDRLAQAESTAKEALELYHAFHNQKGEINALIMLGRIYRTQGKYDLAIETLIASRDASQAIHDTIGEAWANEALGCVYSKAKKPDKATLHFRSAVSLFERAQRPDVVERVQAALEELVISSNTSE